MTAPATTFRSWLARQRRRDDPVGDFARDVAMDPERPAFRSLAEWAYCFAWNDLVRRVLVDAWREFARATTSRPSDRKPPRRLRSGYNERLARARLISPALRQRVFERDEFRCRRCGRDPRLAVLVIDHIVPVARGGTADESNLQTLCTGCNAGKSDRDPHAHDLEIVR